MPSLQSHGWQPVRSGDSSYLVRWRHRRGWTGRRCGVPRHCGKALAWEHSDSRRGRPVRPGSQAMDRARVAASYPQGSSLLGLRQCRLCFLPGWKGCVVCHRVPVAFDPVTNPDPRSSSPDCQLQHRVECSCGPIRAWLLSRGCIAQVRHSASGKRGCVRPIKPFVPSKEILRSQHFCLTHRRGR